MGDEDAERKASTAAANACRVPDDSRYFINIHVSRVIEDSDPLGREEFSYNEVRRICHQLLERSSQHEISLKLADLRGEGFTEKEMHDLRQAFALLDQDKGGTLVFEEAQLSPMLRVSTLRMRVTSTRCSTRWTSTV